VGSLKVSYKLNNEFLINKYVKFMLYIMYGIYGFSCSFVRS
jgi:hypothetical protein